ncbi:MAG: 4-alpha-glucanotransferase [Candidatus Gastranaerophilales bacterium]|nr:4-alpha-glucanotransferase [Candidatus Gastranaerophilales bacterium]
MHGNSFPSHDGEDIGIGSPYANGAKDVADFFSGVIDKCVLGPWGMVSGITGYSPYNSTLESLNPYFIDFKLLTTPEGCELLSRETFEDVVENKPKTPKADYEYVEKSTQRMLDEAYNTYLDKLVYYTDEVIDIHEKVLEYTLDNEGVFFDALFYVLLDEYGTPEYKDWHEIDSKLPILLENNDEQAHKRALELYRMHRSKVDKYMFTQYLASEHAKNAPMTYIADKQVALGKADEWKLQDIILYEIKGKSISLGVPADAFSDKGRCWKMPIIDVHKLFNEDGSLTQGAQRLYKIYQNIFARNKGGVRIDHFQGIIDPYVCVNESAEPKHGAGRLYSSNSKLFNEYKIASKNKKLTDKDIELYSLFFEKIILEAAKSQGLDESNIMPEDLGSITEPTYRAIKKFGLGSMKVTGFVNPEIENHPYRAINSKENDFISIATHDNKPLIDYFYSMSEDKYKKHIDMLSYDLGVKPDYKSPRTHGIMLKFAELFVAPAKNVQIFFSNLMGQNEWYNKPGDKSVPKWSLRMPNNFQEVYLNNMVKGTAFDPYSALALALAKKDKEGNKELIDRLYGYRKEIEKELNS